MGEARKDALRLGFDRAIKLEFHGARVSSDAGLFPYRDLDDAARLTESVAADLFDFRTGNNIRHSMTALLRQSVFSRLAGYEDTNDAERLSEDPVMRHVIGGRAVDRKASSTSEIGRFETDVLTHPDNLTALMNMPGKWVDRIRQRRATKKLILDMDSSVSETFGQQEGRCTTVTSPVRRGGLSPAVPVQPGRRPGAGAAAQRQRPQRRRLAISTGAGGRAIQGR